MKYRLIIDKNAPEEIVVTVHSPSELTDEIENLVLNRTGNNKIWVHGSDEMLQLSFQDIECITIIDRKIFVIDKTGTKHRTNKRLCDLETILPPNFIRINKSAIANENRILRFSTAYNGAVDVIFKCGYKDYVSRRCLADIKRRLDSK